MRSDRIVYTTLLSTLLFQVGTKEYVLHQGEIVVWVLDHRMTLSHSHANRQLKDVVENKFSPVSMVGDGFKCTCSAHMYAPIYLGLSYKHQQHLLQLQHTFR